MTEPAFRAGQSDDTLFIRPRLEEATVSAWRPFAVERVPEPLPEAEGIITALGYDVSIEGDEETGRVRVSTDEYDVEVIGKPGGDLVVPGGQHPDVEAWLRKVHSRYWDYAEELDTVVHIKRHALLTGEEPLASAGQPRLFAPAYLLPNPDWVVPGLMLHIDEYEELSTDAARAFHAFEVDEDGGHQRIALVIVTNNGEVWATLDNQNREDGLDKEAHRAVLELGAQRFAGDIIHQHLHRAANLVILGEDPENFGRHGFAELVPQRP